jgi:tetratricopeptide (TPR) repeat protein
MLFAFVPLKTWHLKVRTFVKHDFMLTPEELRYRQRKRRRILFIALAVLLLAVAGLFVARPLRHGIRSWQARRHAARAFAFIDQQKWREARDEATAAYRLQPNEPQAVRAVARLLSRAGQAEALDFWRNLAKITTLTRNDLRDEAQIALRVKDLAAAGHAVQRLLEYPGGKPAPPDLVLAAEVWLDRRQLNRATDFAQKALADPKATRRDQFRAVIVLDAVVRNGGASLVPNQSEIGKRLEALAGGTDQVSLDALIAIAQHVLAAPSKAKVSSRILIDQLVRDIDNHPLAKISHKLVAVDVEMLQHPEQREEIEQRTINRWKDANNEDLAALAAWLYRHGEYQRLLDTIPLSRAVETRELFLQHVDALGALGRWDDIRKILESERFPLDPVIQNMYLARCYAQQGEQQGADNNWQRAIESAAGDVNKLLMLGDYAQKNGARKVAATAYEAAAEISPKSRAAQLGRLRTIYEGRDTKKIHTALVELLKIWPNDTALQNDEAYTRLLLLPWPHSPEAGDQTPADNEEPIDNPELTAIEHLAQKLLQEEPASLPHRTLLALALLKENRPFTALGLYQNLTVPPGAASASAVAVHAAVLSATGEKKEAQAEIKHLKPEQLLPEERALLPEEE